MDVALAQRRLGDGERHRREVHQVGADAHDPIVPRAVARLGSLDLVVADAGRDVLQKHRVVVRVAGLRVAPARCRAVDRALRVAWLRHPASRCSGRQQRHRAGLVGLLDAAAQLELRADGRAAAARSVVGARRCGDHDVRVHRPACLLQRQSDAPAVRCDDWQVNERALQARDANCAAASARDWLGSGHGHRLRVRGARAVRLAAVGQLIAARDHRRVRVWAAAEASAAATSHPEAALLVQAEGVVQRARRVGELLDEG